MDSRLYDHTFLKLESRYTATLGLILRVGTRKLSYCQVSYDQVEPDFLTLQSKRSGMGLLKLGKVLVTQFEKCMSGREPKDLRLSIKPGPLVLTQFESDVLSVDYLR